MGDEVTELIVIRHGETVWNRDGLMQGHSDVELSGEGIAQAEKLAERLAGEDFAALISSDLKRAMQTAQAIGRRTGHEVIPEPALRERNFGVLESLTWDEIRQRYPELYERYQQRRDFAPPGGETARQRHDRAIACVSRIAADYAGRRVVLVTHGGVLISMFKHAVGLDCLAPRNFSLYNAGLNVFCICDGRWHVAIWGDVTHLPAADLRDHY